MTNRCTWINEEITNLKTSGLYNCIRTIDSPQGSWLVVDGIRVLNFYSNNYLGLANHPKVVEAVQLAVNKYVASPGAIRADTGMMQLHLDLEAQLAIT